MGTVPPLTQGFLVPLANLPKDQPAFVPPNCLVQVLEIRLLQAPNSTAAPSATPRVVILAEAHKLGPYHEVVGNPSEAAEAVTGQGPPAAAAPSNPGGAYPAANSVYGGGNAPVGANAGPYQQAQTAANPYASSNTGPAYSAQHNPPTGPYASNPTTAPSPYGPGANAAGPYGNVPGGAYAGGANAYGGHQNAGNNFGGPQSGGAAYGAPPGGAARPASNTNPYAAPAVNPGPYGSSNAAGPSSVYGSAGPQYNQQGGAIARDNNPPRIIPIKDLNPYVGRWTVKARCTAKGELRRFSGKNGDGKLFSFDLLDKDGGEIRCTVWNQEVDEFYPKVQVGSIYMISQASLVNKKPDFNSTNHSFEMRLDRKSQLELCADDDDSRGIPTIQYHFKRIDELEVTEAKSIVDVIGVVQSVDSWQTLTKRNGEETKKRAVIIRDPSGRSIEVTLWGAFVADPGDQLEQMVRACEHPILAVKGARVGDFNGKTLSTLNSSHAAINPDIPEAARLRHWYDSNGAQTAAQPLSDARGGGQGGASKRCTLTQIRDENLGKRGAPDWITVAGTIQYVQNEPGRIYYPSCSRDFNGRTCSKKLVEQAAGQWWCERCQVQCTQPEYRYILSLTAGDHTGSQWLSAFGDAGEAIVGMPAGELRRIEQEQPEKFSGIIQDLQFKPLLFRLKIAEDSFNDESRIKCSIFSSNPMDYAKECKVLLDLITKMELGQPIMQVPEPKEATAPGTWQPGQNQGMGGGQSYSNAGRGTQAPSYGNAGGSYQTGGRAGGSGYQGPPTPGGQSNAGPYQGGAAGGYQGGATGAYQGGPPAGYQGAAPGAYQGGAGGAPGGYQASAGSYQGGYQAGGRGAGGFSPGPQQGRGNGSYGNTPQYGGGNNQYGGGSGAGGQPFASGFA